MPFLPPFWTPCGWRIHALPSFWTPCGWRIHFIQCGCGFSGQAREYGNLKTCLWHEFQIETQWNPMRKNGSSHRIVGWNCNIDVDSRVKPENDVIKKTVREWHNKKQPEDDVIRRQNDVLLFCRIEIKKQVPLRGKEEDGSKSMHSAN